MNPEPAPTKLERANELEVAASIAYERGDIVFADELSRHAFFLRMEHQQECLKRSVNT